MKNSIYYGKMNTRKRERERARGGERVRARERERVFTLELIVQRVSNRILMDLLQNAKMSAFCKHFHLRYLKVPD